MLPVTALNAGSAGHRVPKLSMLASQSQQSILWAVDAGWMSEVLFSNDRNDTELFSSFHVA